MKRTLLSLLALAAAAPLFAQATLGLPGAAIGSNFFAALVCGVIIAFAMQYLLTALSVAAGVSAVPNLKEKYAAAKASEDDDDHERWNAVTKKNAGTPTGVKVSAAIGVWNTITTAIALFTGAALAMKLVPAFAETPGTSVTLALTIWGTFFMLLFWLESRFASTMVGGLISTATSGLKAAADSVTSLLTPSPAAQVASVADATVDKLEASFGSNFDTDRIVGAIEDFGKRIDGSIQSGVERVDKQLPSYDKLVADLRSILNDSSKNSGSNPAKWTALQSLLQTAIESGDSSDSEKGKAKSAQLKQLLQEFKAEYDQSGGNPEEAAKQTAAAETDFDEAEIDQYVSKIEEMLRSSSEDDFSGGGLGEKLQSIIDNQGISLEGLRNGGLAERLQSMDREQVTNLVAKNTSLSKEKVESYVDQAVSAISMVRDQLGVSKSNAHKNGQVNGSGGSLLAEVQNVDLDALTKRAKEAIAAFVQSDDAGASPEAGPSIRRRGDNVVILSEEEGLAALKRDLVKAMNNPSDTLEILRHRLANFDSSTVLDLLPVSQSQLRSKRAQLERTLDEAKAEVETRANELQAKAQGALRQAERRAVIEAEHARQTASSAAWWLVLSIVVSGVASLGGALLS